MNPNVLKRFLWGKFYYKQSEKKIVKSPPNHDSEELFVKFVMKPLVQLYLKHMPQELMQGTTQAEKLKAH